MRRTVSGIRARKFLLKRKRVSEHVLVRARAHVPVGNVVREPVLTSEFKHSVVVSALWQRPFGDVLVEP